MARRRGQAVPLGQERWTSGCELSLQVQPLKRNLSGADRKGFDRPDRTELGPVKGIASTHGLVMDGAQVRVDRKARMGMRPEAFQLGMPCIAACLAAEDRPGQQRLAPQGDQALRVEILRMQRPEAHG